MIMNQTCQQRSTKEGIFPLGFVPKNQFQTKSNPHHLTPFQDLIFSELEDLLINGWHCTMFHALQTCPQAGTDIDLFLYLNPIGVEVEYSYQNQRMGISKGTFRQRVIYFGEMKDYPAICETLLVKSGGMRPSCRKDVKGVRLIINEQCFQTIS